MHLDIQHRGGGGIRNDQVPHAHTSAHIVPINNVWWCKRPCIYSTIVQCSAVTSKYCWNWPFSNGDISKIHRVHKNFLSANESSIFQRPINKILEIFTESKICYEFSKLGRKLRFFSKKSEILNFSKKKNFDMLLVLTETSIICFIKSSVGLTICPAGQKTVSAIFRGKKTGYPHYLPPGGSKAEIFLGIK